jgi:hypothetical protein
VQVPFKLEHTAGQDEARQRRPLGRPLLDLRSDAEEPQIAVAREERQVPTGLDRAAFASAQQQSSAPTGPDARFVMIAIT